MRFVFFVGVAVLAAGGCGSQGDTPGPGGATKSPDQEILDFSSTETFQGSKSWTLFADKAEVFDGKGYSKVEGVKVEFYGPEGEVSSVLTSLKGRVDDERKNLQAYGRVVLRTTDGVVLETETLHWDNIRGVVWSNDFVTVTRGTEVLTGYGLESDPNLTDVRVKSRVKIKMEGDGNGDSVEDSTKAPGAARRM